jgi:peptide/nickel transport system substrate-binding protein
VAQYLRQELLQVGIDMEILLTEPATTWAILDSEDFDLLMSGWGTITLDCDMGLYRNFHSSLTREHFADFFVDKMLEFGRASSDQEARREAYEMALIEISTKLLRIPLYVANHVYGISTKVHGFEPRSDEMFDNLEYVTVDE